MFNVLRQIFSRKPGQNEEQETSTTTGPQYSVAELNELTDREGQLVDNAEQNGENSE